MSSAAKTRGVSVTLDQAANHPCRLCQGTGWQLVEGGAIRCTHGLKVVGSVREFESRASVDELLLTERSRSGEQLTGDEYMVARCLKDALGQALAVPRKQIEKATDLSERKVKEAVEGLRGKQVDVGSLRGYRRPVNGRQGATPPHGYYFIINHDDLDATVLPLYSQALSELRTIQTLTRGRAAYRRRVVEQLGQATLPLGGKG